MGHRYLCCPVFRSYDCVERYGAVQTDNDVRGPSDRFFRTFFRLCSLPLIVEYSIAFLHSLARRRGVLRIFNENTPRLRRALLIHPSHPFAHLFLPGPSSELASKTCHFHSMTALSPVLSTQAHGGDVVVRL